MHLCGKAEEAIGVFNLVLFGKYFELQIAQVAIEMLKSFTYQFGIIDRVEGERIGPAENLRLELFRKLFTKALESNHLVALGYQDIHRQAHAEDPLRLPQLPIEAGGLLFEAKATLIG